MPSCKSHWSWAKRVQFLMMMQPGGGGAKGVGLLGAELASSFLPAIIGSWYWSCDLYAPGRSLEAGWCPVR